jgi:release factor glutamine methyltransferase
MKGAMDLFKAIKAAIDSVSNESEKEAMAFLILEFFDIPRNAVFSNISAKIDINLLQKIISRINNGEPLQYILGYAWFYNRKFKVSPAVLIPRPETELLIDQILSFQGDNSKLVLLDLGTGSGVIPITTALARPGWKLFASDISADALEIARQNAIDYAVDINWICADMLKAIPEIPGGVDILVSNPPYVSLEEKSTLHRQVIDFEPHTALFASDTDPLNFYRAISLIGNTLLRSKGLILVEVNERYGAAVQKIFLGSGFKSVKVLTDMDGKSRIVRVEH